MHQSSYDKMTGFCQKYLENRREESLEILDIGSMNVNGCYRPIFSNPSWRYQGVDMEPGANVDVVLKDPYTWAQIPTDSIDVLISGQAFEHIQYFWITILEVARVLKPGGIACIIAPSSGHEHRYPYDCWRFYPDGLVAMAKFAGVDVVEATTQWHNAYYADGSDEWHDSMLVLEKPASGSWKNLKSRVKRFLQHRVLTMGLA